LISGLAPEIFPSVSWLAQDALLALQFCWTGLPHSGCVVLLAMGRRSSSSVPHRLRQICFFGISLFQNNVDGNSFKAHEMHGFTSD